MATKGCGGLVWSQERLFAGASFKRFKDSGAGSAAGVTQPKTAATFILSNLLLFLPLLLCVSGLR